MCGGLTRLSVCIAFCLRAQRPVLVSLAAGELGIPSAQSPEKGLTRVRV